MWRASQLDETSGTPLLLQANDDRQYGATIVAIPSETSCVLPKNNSSNANLLPFCVIRNIFSFMLMHDGKNSDVSIVLQKGSAQLSGESKEAWKKRMENTANVYDKENKTFSVSLSLRLISKLYCEVFDNSFLFPFWVASAYMKIQHLSDIQHEVQRRIIMDQADDDCKYAGCDAYDDYESAINPLNQISLSLPAGLNGQTLRLLSLQQIRKNFSDNNNTFSHAHLIQELTRVNSPLNKLINDIKQSQQNPYFDHHQMTVKQLEREIWLKKTDLRYLWVYAAIMFTSFISGFVLTQVDKDGSTYFSRAFPLFTGVGLIGLSFLLGASLFIRALRPYCGITFLHNLDSHKLHQKALEIFKKTMALDASQLQKNEVLSQTKKISVDWMQRLSLRNQQTPSATAENNYEYTI